MPTSPPGPGTTTAEAAAAVMRRAASRIVTSGAQITGGPPTSAPTGWSPDGVGAGRRRAGLLQGRASHVRRQAVAERVLVGAGAEARRHPGEHRRMAEQLARAESIEHPLLTEQLDRPPAHDPGVAGRAGGGREDLGARGEELDLHRGRDALDLLRRERVERGVTSQELGDVVHARERYEPAGSAYDSCPSSASQRRMTRCIAAAPTTGSAG